MRTKTAVMRRLVCALSMGIAAWGAATSAQAAIVQHSYVQLGGTHWQVNLGLFNDSAPSSFAGFSVYFEPGVFSNLAVASSPTGWDSIVLQPDTGLPASGLFDALALMPGAVPPIGQLLGGFSATFDWTGRASNPGRLPYTINDANFNVLASGLTVPEPASALLAGLALAALVAARRKHGNRSPEQAQPTEICA